jgi:hypothetical protein
MIGKSLPKLSKRKTEKIKSIKLEMRKVIAQLHMKLRGFLGNILRTYISIV